MKLKYTSSKWFLENNGEWIEIDEKDLDKVKWMVWSNITTYESFKSWQPTNMTDLYSLPDDVGFEIEETDEIESYTGYTTETLKYKMKKVAHLKVEQIKQINEDFLGTHDEIIKYNQTYGKQEQSEIERLREENERIRDTWASDIEIIKTLRGKIKELESKLSQLPILHKVIENKTEVLKCLSELEAIIPVHVKARIKVLADQYEELEEQYYKSNSGQLPKEEEQGTLWDEVENLDSKEEAQSQFTISRK